MSKPTQTPRLNIFKSFLKTDTEKAFINAFNAQEGDWSKISETIAGDPLLSKKAADLHLINQLADLSGDHLPLVKSFMDNPKTNSLRDIALNFGKDELVELVDATDVPDSIPGDTQALKKANYVAELQTKLFAEVPTAVVQRLVATDTETPIADPVLRGGISTFLNNQGEAFNIKTTSVYEAFKTENAFKGIDARLQADVKTGIKTLQRVAAISPVAEAIPVLMKAKIHTAYQVSEMSAGQIVRAFEGQLGENGAAIAQQIHTNAVNARIRNEHALMALKEAGQGTGIAMIDKSLRVKSTDPSGVAARGVKSPDPATGLDWTLEKHNLSWDLLFGDADFCECGECTSVYSAAAYFVELLQYLRNNNLDPNATGAQAIKSDPKDISGTVLEKLFDRRPDLGCLELTCPNTNTILPYVDLVNEVMENYVVFKHPKPFNVGEETSAELLAQPQHTEYQAYCILKDEVYPCCLPYHQPIDSARINLEFLGTSRADLIDTFRSPRKITKNPDSLADCDPNTPDPDPGNAPADQLLDQLHEAYIDCAVDAEYLGLTQEEFVILTKEAFVSKEFWDKQCGVTHTLEEYQTKIGVKPIHQYYGYDTELEMLDDQLEEGLTFVKKQFLPRTGIQYTDLVDLLLTQCLNPNMPRGKAMLVTEGLHFSYRFLQNFKAVNGEDKLIELLTNSEKLVQLFPDLKELPTFFNLVGNKTDLACPPDCKEEDTLSAADIKNWVKCHFERIGKMIVLENGGKCSCIGGVFRSDEQGVPHDTGAVLSINSNCEVELLIQKEKFVVGQYNCSTGEVSITNNEFIQLKDLKSLSFTTADNIAGYWDGDKLLNSQTKTSFRTYQQAKDTCDLDTVRLIHLDGTALTVEEYGHIIRFIRLWCKLGWSIDEIDKALVGLSPSKEDCLKDEMPGKDDCDDCGDLFDNSGDCKDCADDGGCHGKSETMFAQCAITPQFLHQLVAVKKLLDRTGLELIKLLTCWTDISTSGEKSLYKRLFLTHNLLGMDKVFAADKNGNYLTQGTKISEHKPVVMAAFNLSSDDLDAIIAATAMTDKLTLANLSLLYRYRLISKVLGLKIPAFIDVLPLFGNPFPDADTTLEFMERWARMEDAGFDYRQLNYIIRDFDDPKKPLSPTEISILKLAKTLYDGLNAIQEAHKDLAAQPSTTDPGLQLLEIQAQASPEMVRAKAALLFDPSVVEQITGLLEGTNIFITNAPVGLTAVSDKLNAQNDDPNLPVSDVISSLRKKIKYNNDVVNIKASVQVTGILTADETAEVNAWSNNAEWGKSLTRLEKQQGKLFKAILFDVFEAEKALSTMREAEVSAAEAIIKGGDISIAFDEIPVGQADTNTAAPKRVAFLGVFLPYLRKVLEHRFVVDTLSGLVSLEREATDLLISEVLKLGSPAAPIYSIFEKIKDSAMPVATGWQGYLIPSSESDFTFIVKNGSITIPPNLSIEGSALLFEQQEDPTDEWWSKPQKLQAGKLYKLSVVGTDLKNVFWKTATSSISAIPPAALLPDFASTQCTPAFILLKKAALIVAGFNLSVDEIRYFNGHSSDFSGLDFNHISFKHWLRIEAYTRLRNTLPETKTNILAFFNWTTTVVDATEKALLSEKISNLTLWKKGRIDQLITVGHFNLNDVDNFRNEENLLKLQQAIAVADKIGMDIDLLFDWAKPTSNFKKCRNIADSIEKAIRAQYTQTDWEQVIKPLHDKLRNNQKNALVKYLLQRPELKTWGVTDADGLFEYFLIDVQMEPCMETSRIVQANSSVQLFVMRCFLGLEEEHNGISPDVLDRGRWEWMERYRVWEANRKVFLYPENWIESNLRDDKSPFFKELESELLQKDINKQNVTDALKSYLYKVDEVANMEVVGLYIEHETYDGKPVHKLHVFARTRNAPYFFFYRYLDILEGNWYPWEKMQVDIPSYDVEDANGTITLNGCYLTPVVWNGRLLIFFPQFMKKTKVSPLADIPLRFVSDMSTKAIKPFEYWEIKMAWCEYKNNKWTQKQISKFSLNDIPNTTNFNNAVASVKVRVNAAELAASALVSAENDAKKAEAELQKAAGNIHDGSIADRFTTFVNAVNNYIDKVTILNTAKEAKKTADEAVKSAFATAEAEANLIKPITEYSIISNYEFRPVVNQMQGIKVEYDNRSIGIFEFTGSGIAEASVNYSGNNTIEVDNFHHNSHTIKSLQISSEINQYAFSDNGNTSLNSSNFYHPYTHILLGKINTGSLETFFKYNTESITGFTAKGDAFGFYDSDQDVSTPNIYHELKRPYAIYNWELFFHTPMMLADALSKAQHFEEAMKWYHFVFSPLSEGTDDNRFWQFSPFKDINSQRILDRIFNGLQPNTADEAISAWRNHPFMPHLIARDRPVAYMKWVVMKYLDNLIAWGDYLFRQDTIETINQATQLYVLAGHILGPKPMMIPKRGKKKPQTYLGLLDKWDAFGNAMVELELAAPYSNQITTPIGNANGVTALANVFGFSTALYFCIPNNPKLMGYWDTIADRLFKIRHCENIEGIFRKLPLFEPPIDPALLVNAAAQGLSIASVLNDLNTPMPNYRFYYLLQKALELCGELKSLGGAMLSAIEKKDNESIALIRAKHESVMHNLVMEVKKQQLEEAEKSLETLVQNRKAPEHRMKYYLQLIGEDAGKVPGLDSDFSEIANAIETPVDEGGLKLIKYEKEEMDKSHAAADWQIGIGVVEMLASIFHAIPSTKVSGEPLGVGASIIWGGPNLGSLTQALAKGMQTYSSHLSYQSSNAGRKGGFTRAIQDRIMQANAAGYEIKQIDKQIAAQEIRIAIANLEITNQQKQIDNANEIEEFLKNKYSNEELYTWMRDSLKTLYHQVYSLAYDLAKKSEKVYRFERGLTSSSFIQSGYWDAGREGLLSGERLYVGLKQLEAAYQENRGYDYEITKHISLRQINPLAVLQLKETGKCEFELPEILFDMDFPGHYKRRIKSVSLSIPCIAGPYTNINGTMRLLENKFRNTALAKDKNDYPEKTDESDDRFSTYIIPISAIAASSAQNDSGMFELNFKDERYLPFEGAGVISKWRLELPSFRQFDYDTISDAVLHVRYTASEGGERLKKAANDSVFDFMKENEEIGQQEGLFAVIDLKHDLPNQWHKAMQVNPGDTQRTLSIPAIQDFLPYYVKLDKDGNARDTNKILITDVVLLAYSNLQADEFAVVQGEEDEIAFTGGSVANSFVIHQEITVGDWKLLIKNTNKTIEKALMVVRFVLK